MSRPQPVVTSLRGGPNRGSSTRHPLRVMAASSNPSPLHARLVIQNVLIVRAHLNDAELHVIGRSLPQVYMYIHIHVLMRDEKEERKKQQTNKAKQHSTPKAVTFPKKNELPLVGLKPMTLYTCTLARTYMYMYLPVMTSSLLVYTGLEREASVRRSTNSTCVSAAFSWLMATAVSLPVGDSLAT